MSGLKEQLLVFKEQGLSLRQILCRILPCFMDYFDDIAWNSLDITYHPPHVERLWTQLDTMRLMVHRIHPTKEVGDALFHPHPWPSAVFIISGSYEMGLGYGETAESPQVIAKTLLTAGSSYEMIHKNGWHYVAPKGEPSTSLMLIDSPWDEPHPFYLASEKVRLNPLTERARSQVINSLRDGIANL